MLDMKLIDETQNRLKRYMNSYTAKSVAMDHKDILAAGVAAYSILVWVNENEVVNESLSDSLKDIYNELSKQRYDTETQISFVRRSMLSELCDILSTVYLALALERADVGGVLSV